MASNSGSLFGGSLFGGGSGLSNTTAQQPNSLSTSNNPSGGTGGASPFSGSLFGGTSSFANTTAQQPSNSATSNNATSGTGGSSLFGGSLLGGGGTSSFGNTTAQQTNSFSTSNNATSGFGGGSAANNQPQTSSLFGQTQPGQSSTLGQTQTNAVPLQGQQPDATKPAFFNSLLERGKKRTHSISRQNGNFEDMPGLQLGLDDIRRKARELGSLGNKDNQHKEATTKAHYLLSASGITPGQALRDLRTLDPQVTAASTREPDSFDPDNQKFLRNMQQRGRQVMIEESLARAQKDFDTFLEDKVDMDWEDQRRKIFKHFGLSQADDQGAGNFKSTSRGAFGRSGRQSKQAGGVLGRSALEKSVIGTPGAGLASRQLFEDPTERAEGHAAPPSNIRFFREKMGNYAPKVQELNVARLQDQAYPILHQFSEVELLTGGDTPRQLRDAYQALVGITRESPNMMNRSDPSAVRERHYAEDYLDDSTHSSKSIALKKQILEGSRQFLEKRFFAEVEELVAKNPREAQVGGIPSVVNKLRGYIRIRDAKKDLFPDTTDSQNANQTDCWALVFYLLRCGFVTEAAQVVSEDTRFRSLDMRFITYMTTYAQNRQLPRDLQQKINGEYQQRLRNAPENTIDPYRMACYKIIGRCDLSRRGLDGVKQNVEDWMWLQFILAREGDYADDVSGDTFGLEDIQTDIHEIGQHMFSKGQDAASGYGTFFLLQILGGMFEQAVSSLISYAPVTAVHFAIALSYYGLLRVSDFFASGEEILSFSVKQCPQINFGYLITQYTREFRTGYVDAAVDYFSLICLNADLPGEMGKSQAAVCHEALREFILETRDFAKLLGDIRSDGTRIKGIIEQRLELINLADQEDFLKNITVQAASVADDKGLITDSVLLYHLAEDYDHVIEIINRALSDAIAVELGGNMPKLQPLMPRVEQAQGADTEVPGSSLSLTAVDDPLVLGKNMISLYNSNPMYFERIRSSNRDPCGLLIRMLEAKIEVESGRWTPALDLIDQLRVLPLQANGSVSDIRSTAQSFSSSHEIIARNIGHVIIWCITCIGHERHRQISSPFETEMHQNFADRLLAMAKDLMVFAGMVKYKLPPRVYEALARAGADIGAY
ncbi:Nuclear pore protein (Nic96) [Penicillium capsulatum]|nr:Nuclear pore protein (Nic96) [Penicillium capsulatum]